MRELLSHHIADRQVLWLIDRILESGAGIQDGEAPATYFPGDTLFSILRLRGLPIGNLTPHFYCG